MEEYFDRMEVKSGHAIPVKRVYVASDDSKVLAECRKSYPSFTFLGDQSIAKSAAVNSRYNLASLKGVISDIHLLSQSDYLVCTFSSQVWPLTQLFSVSFFVKKFIDLPGGQINDPASWMILFAFVPPRNPLTSVSEP